MKKIISVLPVILVAILLLGTGTIAYAAGAYGFADDSSGLVGSYDYNNSSPGGGIWETSAAPVASENITCSGSTDTSCGFEGEGDMPDSSTGNTVCDELAQSSGLSKATQYYCTIKTDYEPLIICVQGLSGSNCGSGATGELSNGQTDYVHVQVFTTKPTSYTTYQSGKNGCGSGYTSVYAGGGSKCYLQDSVPVQNPAPTASLTASPGSITRGNSSTLSYECTNATSASINNGVGTVSPSSGTSIVSPTTTTTYTLTCTGSGGTATSNATVTVTAPPVPTAQLTANPTSIVSGNSSTLTWTSTNATSCTGTNFSTGNAVSNLSPGVSVSPTATTQYTVTCTGAGGSATSNATVTVTAPPTLPDLTASDVTPTGTVVGTPVTLAALISNANAPTGAAFHDLFQDTTSVPGSSCVTDGSCVTDAGTYANAAMAAGGTTNAQLSYNFPSSGTYYVRACADKSSKSDTGVITESNENNNCSPDWIAITVCASGQTWNGSACVITGGTAAACTLTASPPTISGSQTSTLSWSATNATSCTSSNIPGFPGGISGNVGGIGASQVGNPYQVTCTGAGGSGSCTATVTNSGGGGSCTPDSTVNLEAASLAELPLVYSNGPIRVQAAQNGANNVSLQFSSVNVSSGGACHITRSDTNTTTNFPGSACLVNGTTVSVSVTHETKFTLSCDGVAGTDSVVVNITPGFQEF